MSRVDIYLSFQNYTHHEELVNDLSPVFSCNIGDYVYFTIDINTEPKILYGDLLILLVSAVKYLKSKNIAYNGVFTNFKKHSDTVQYASRINFFKHMEILLPESFIRKNSDARFTEIIEYADGASALELHNKVIKILNGADSLHKSVIEMLSYTLHEVLDNVITHSTACGFSVTQMFKYKKEIRLMICDNGIGIHQSLTKPGSTHSELSPAKAIEMCTQKGVTNGEGMGNGLYHTKEFIKQNKGSMTLHTGTYVYKVDSAREKIYHTSNWEGTYVFLKINTSNVVDEKNIVGDGFGLSDNFDFIFG